MKRGVKTAAKAVPRRGITLKGPGATPEGQAAAVAAQKAWAYAVAVDIERGELPDASNERRMIAAIVRAAADQLHVPKARKRGNPSFIRKLPDDDTVALMVGTRIAHGDDPPAAIRAVASCFDDIDESTIRKLFGARRDAVADYFAQSNLRHRCGAIRGE